MKLNLFCEMQNSFVKGNCNDMTTQLNSTQTEPVVKRVSRKKSFAIFLGMIFLLFTSITSLRAQDLIYVNYAATGNNDGTSPANAFTSLTKALEAVDSHLDEVRVAEGTYTPAAMTMPANITNLNQVTFLVRYNITIQGGWNAAFTDQNPVAHPTVLDGAEGTIAAYHVMVWSAVTTDGEGLLDGFIIQDGGKTSSSSGSTNYGTAYNNAYGAGLYVGQGNMAIANCKFDNNTALMASSPYGYGGAIYVAARVRYIRDCMFTNNKSYYAGGAIYFSSTNAGNTEINPVVVEQCSFINNAKTFYSTNASYGYGGAIHSESYLIVRNNTFTGNSSAYRGAAISVNAGKTWLYNNTITGNRSEQGFAVSPIAGQTILSGNIIVGNNVTANTSADLQGTTSYVSNGYNMIGETDQISYLSGLDYRILNKQQLTSILGGSTAPASSGMGLDYTPPTLTDVNAADHFTKAITPQSSVFAACALQHVPMEKRVNQATLYNGDYVDQMDNPITGANATYYMGSVNLSAVCDVTTWYVTVNGTGDGTTPATPTQLSTILRSSCLKTGDTIKVAKGLYKPSDIPATSTDGRQATFFVPRAVVMLGGWDASFTSRDTLPANLTNSAQATVLSGDIGQIGVSEDNAYHVILWNTLDTIRGVFDGFTVTDGYSAGTVTSSSIALSDGVSVTSTYGAGLIVYHAARLTLRNNAFINNMSQSLGAGIAFLTNYSEGRNVTVENNIFRGNKIATAASGGGVGLYVTYSTNLRIVGNWFDQNTWGAVSTGADYAGSAFTITQLKGPAFVEKNSFTNNDSKTGYGTLYFGTGNNYPIYVRNNTFSGNKAANGSALYLYEASTLTYIYNNTFHNNQAGTGSNQSVIYQATGTLYFGGNLFTANLGTVRAVRINSGTGITEGYNIYASDGTQLSNVTAHPFDRTLSIALLPGLIGGTYSDGIYTSPALSVLPGLLTPVLVPLPGFETENLLQRVPQSNLNNSPSWGTQTAGNFADQTNEPIISNIMSTYFVGSVNRSVDLCQPSSDPLTWYVDASGPDGFGTTPGNSSRTIERILSMPCFKEGDTIKVAQGSYTPGPMVGDMFANPRNCGYFIQKSVIMRGGYVGGGDFSEANRDVAANLTILTGKSTPSVQQTGYQANIVTWNCMSGAGEIDGFTVRDMNANLGNFTYNGTSYNQGRGALQYYGDGELILRNVTFKNNIATSSGVTIYYAANAKHLTLENCLIDSTNTFSSNTVASGQPGAGIYLAANSGDLTVRHSTFSGLRARNGAAIYHEGLGNIVLEDNIFRRNMAIGNGDSYDGGAIYSVQPASVWTINRNIFQGNEANTYDNGSDYARLAGQTGGAIYLGNATLLSMRDNWFDGNKAKSAGSAVCLATLAAFGPIEFNTFTNNQQTRWVNYSNQSWNTGTLCIDGNGGGATLIQVNYNTFYNNYAESGGAAMSIANAQVNFFNNTVVGNSNTRGGSVQISDAYPDTYSQKIVGAGNLLGGNSGTNNSDIYLRSIYNAGPEQSVAWSSFGYNLLTAYGTSSTNTEIHYAPENASDQIYNSGELVNIFGGSMNGALFVANSLTTPIGKIAPVLYPLTTDYAQSWLKTIPSSYLNTIGTHGAMGGADYFDQTGQIIQQADPYYNRGSVNTPGVIVCMHPANGTWYVDLVTGSSSNDGITPATPKATLNDVLNAPCLEEGDTIKVTKGHYEVGSMVGIVNNSERDRVLYINKAINILGGYDDVTYTTRTPYGSVLSGELGNQLITADNAYNIIIWNTPSDGSTGWIDGFEISGANTVNATNPSLVGMAVNIPRSSGAGIFVNSGKVRITNNLITKNTANNFGGAIAVMADGYAEITGNIIDSNTSVSNGAGVYIVTNNGMQDWNLSHNTFSNNSTSAIGGALFMSGSAGNMNLENSQFISNSTSSTGSGGGAYFSGTFGDVDFANSVFTGNSTGTSGYGSAVYFSVTAAGTIDIVNAEFLNNTAGALGSSTETHGTLYFDGPMTLNIENNLFRGNAANGAAGIYTVANAGMILNKIKANWFDGNISAMRSSIGHLIHLNQLSTAVSPDISLNTFTDNRLQNAGYVSPALFILGTQGTINIRYNTFVGNDPDAAGSWQAMGFDGTTNTTTGGAINIFNNTIIGNGSRSDYIIYATNKVINVNLGANLVIGNYSTTGTGNVPAIGRAGTSANFISLGYNATNRNAADNAAVVNTSDLVLSNADLPQILDGAFDGTNVRFVPNLTFIPGYKAPVVFPSDNVLARQLLQRVPIGQLINFGIRNDLNTIYIDQAYDTIQTTAVFFTTGSVNIEGDACDRLLDGFPVTWYVDANAPATGTGMFATDASQSLAGLLISTCVLPGDTIKVAQGTYYPSTVPTAIGDSRNATFYVGNALTILGGYKGDADFTEANRDIINNETVLSGNIGVPESDLDNVYHVMVWNVGNTVQAGKLEGFTIRDGYAYGSSSMQANGESIWDADGNRVGAGLLVNAGNVTIQNNRFTRNSSQIGGSAVAITGAKQLGTKIPIFSNNMIDSNYSAAGSPGLWVNTSTQIDVIEMNMFNANEHSSTSNSASMGALHINTVIPISSSSVRVHFNTFTNNTSDGYGAAVYLQAMAVPVIFNNNTIVGNSSYQGRAGFYLGYTPSATATVDFFGNIVIGNRSETGTALANAEIYNPASSYLTSASNNFGKSYTDLSSSDMIIAPTDIGNIFPGTLADTTRAFFIPTLTPVIGKQYSVLIPHNNLYVRSFVQVVSLNKLNADNGVSEGTGYIDQRGQAINLANENNLYFAGSVNDNTGSCPSVTTWYVNPRQSGDGTSPSNASPSLEAILYSACLNPGDTVKVAYGTYVPGYMPGISSSVRARAYAINKPLTLLGSYDDDFQTRDIKTTPTILSADNPEAPLSDQNFYRVMLYQTSDTTLHGTVDGFVFRDAYCNTSSSNTSFTYNGQQIYDRLGTGLYVRQGKVSITNNIFRNNFSYQNDDGGVLYIYNNCRIPEISGNWFDGNRNGNLLNIYTLDNQNLVIEYNTFSDNISARYPIKLQGTFYNTIRYNTIVNNSCFDIYSTAIANIYNNTIVGNNLTRGYGIYATVSNTLYAQRIEGNVIIGNRGISTSGTYGLYLSSYTSRYNITQGQSNLGNNTTNSYDIPVQYNWQAAKIFPGTITGTETDLQGVFTADLTHIPGVVPPVLIPKDNTYAHAFLLKVPYTVLTNNNGPYRDARGEAIISANDLYYAGAVSLPTVCPVGPRAWYVDANGPDGDGLTPATAIKELQAVLSSACFTPGDTVKMAQGTYKAQYWMPGLLTTSIYSKMFYVPKNAVILGGYRGNGDFTDGNRDFVTQKTILDAEEGQTAFTTDNLYNLMKWVADPSDTAQGRIDGLVFQKTYYNSSSGTFYSNGKTYYYQYGTALGVYCGNISLTNNVFQTNQAYTNGVVYIYSNTGITDPNVVSLGEVKYNYFYDNRAGGALWIGKTKNNNIFNIEMNTFEKNVGSALRISGANIDTVRYNTFVGNSGGTALDLSGTNNSYNYVFNNLALGNLGNYNHITIGGYSTTSSMAGANVVIGNQAAGYGLSFSNCTNYGYNVVQATNASTPEITDILVTNDLVPEIYVGTLSGGVFVPDMVSVPGRVYKVPQINTGLVAQTYLQRVDLSQLSRFGYREGSTYVDQTFTPINRFNAQRTYYAGSLNDNALDCTPTDVWYVDVNKTTAGDGLTPATAATSLEAVLYSTCLEDGDTIKIAQGTYLPGFSPKANNATSYRMRTYLISKNVILMGGYHGNGDFTKTNRDFVNKQTIFTGDWDGNQQFEDNLTHLVVWNPVENTDYTGKLDGIIFYGASTSLSGATLPGTALQGAAVYHQSGYLDVTNNVFTKCLGSSVFNSINTGLLEKFSDNWVHDNQATTAVVYIQAARGQIFEGNTFSYNRGNGTATLYIYHSAAATSMVSVRNNTFVGNENYYPSSPSSSGYYTIYANSNTYMTFTQNTVVGNKTNYAVYLDGTLTYFGGNIVVGNSASETTTPRDIYVRASGLNLNAGGYNVAHNISPWQATDLKIARVENTAGGAAYQYSWDRELSWIFDGYTPTGQNNKVFTLNSFPGERGRGLTAIPGKQAPVLVAKRNITTLAALLRVPADLLYSTFSGSGTFWGRMLEGGTGEFTDQSGRPIVPTTNAVGSFFYVGAYHDQLNADCSSNPDKVWYVNTNISSAQEGDGRTPQHPVRDLSSLIRSVCVADGDTIKVATGNYYPVLNTVGTTNDRLRSFFVDRNLFLLGGYDSTFTVRKPTDPAYKTTLDGEFGGDNTDANNIYHVVIWKIANEYSMSPVIGLLDGFEIARGFAEGDNTLYTTVASGRGGGLYLDYGNLNIHNCKFYKNSANNGSGGAIYTSLTSVLFSLKDCWFTENKSTSYGGAAYIQNGGGMLIERNSFTDNSSNSIGGALYITSPTSSTSYASIYNNTFLTNTGTYGAGIYSGVPAYVFKNTAINK